MKRDIILSGVGGQGILSIAAVIGRAALEDGLHIKQAEVHGMSQRGGDVQSNLRISSSAIRSDLIPRGAADLIVSMEPMEALRYLPWLADDGWVITGITPLINIPNYPEGETLRRELEKLCDYVAFLHKGKLLLCEEKDLLLSEYGILHCKPYELPENGVLHKKQNPYGVEAIVRRDAVKPGTALSPISMEELFVFMSKEAK